MNALWHAVAVAVAVGRLQLASPAGSEAQNPKQRLRYASDKAGAMA